MEQASNDFKIETIRYWLRHEYDLGGDLSRLPGENLNFEVRTGDGNRFVLKLSHTSTSPTQKMIENQVINHLEKMDLELGLPRILPTKSGKQFFQVNDQGVEYLGCMQTYVDGIAWGRAGTAGGQQLQDLGIKLAQLDLALSNLQEESTHRTHQWDLATAAQHRKKLDLLSDPDRRRMVEWMFHLYAASAVPHLPGLPHSLIHGDANDENLLVKDGKVVGLLDFGDALQNPTICELAIALAYAMLGQPEPLIAGAEVVAGYHSVKPLTQPEIEVLYPLICGRLCTTVLIAAERRRIDPTHPTWFETEDRAWHLLEQLHPLDPRAAKKQLYSTIGQDIPAPPGGNMKDLLRARKRVIGPSLSVAYEDPIKMVRGEGQFLFDDRDKPYLDLVNNVCHVGHCHPTVVEAGQQQMALLNTNTRYVYDGLTDYAERLCSTIPNPLEVCFFVNSGSEANELALRLAETYTGRKDFLVIDGAYHGNTGKLVDLSPYKFMGKGGKGEPEPWVHVVPMPDGYRGLHRGYQRETGWAYGDEVGEIIRQSTEPIAGFIAESLLGCGGQIIPPAGYFERAFEHVRAAGGVCIIDEVQVGFGRAGTHFWAFERFGVVPDIVVLGKPIGNGHPMGAVVTTREIADAFANGMEFFSTFGGNPVSCAIGMAVLDVIQEQELQQNALVLGQYFLEGLHGLKAHHDIIGDVRGAGLFIGVELVLNRDTLEPAAAEAADLVERMKSRGVLLSTDGPLHNVIKIKPPMVITREDIDMVLRVMGDALAGLHAA